MRLPALLVVVLLLASCSDAPADGASATEPRPSTSAAESTTTTAAETTTTTAPPTTTTTAPPPVPGSPVDALDSFEWTFHTGIAVEGADTLSIDNTGVFVDGEFECRVETGLEGADVTTTMAFLSTDEGVHLDAGDGFELLGTEDVRRDDALGICPGSNVFWRSLTGGDPLPDDGEPETVNGQPAIRIDQDSLVGEDGRGVLGQPGVDFDHLVFWVTEEGWITALEIAGDLDAEALAELTGTNSGVDGRLDLRVDVTAPDDPGLELPPV